MRSSGENGITIIAWERLLSGAAFGLKAEMCTCEREGERPKTSPSVIISQTAGGSLRAVRDMASGVKQRTHHSQREK